MPMFGTHGEIMCFISSQNGPLLIIKGRRDCQCWTDMPLLVVAPNTQQPNQKKTLAMVKISRNEKKTYMSMLVTLLERPIKLEKWEVRNVPVRKRE